MSSLTILETYYFTKTCLMKKPIYYVLCYLVIATRSFSADPPTFSSKVSDVTVFTKGAMVTRVVDTKGLMGQMDIIIHDLPLSIIDKTLIVESMPGIEVISVNVA